MERSRQVVHTAALLVVATTAAIGAISPSSAAAQTLADLPDVRSIRPVVMLLVDTSGSMERKPIPASGPGCGECKPVCTGSPADVNEKNRWAITIEALTGSFDQYRCYERDRSGTGFTPADYDYGYFLPHYDFFGTRPTETTSTQIDDGLLDSFSNVAKFGLMTFDGVGTTLGGDTLVPLNPSWSDPTYLALVNGPQGMYSYGRVGELSFPGCTDQYGFNAGARGAAPVGVDVPGALISVGVSDDATAISAVNTSIQDSLRRVRPFGGTPIAAMLDDLRYYLQNDDGVRNGSDRYFNCRDRYAILLTDGAPDALFRDTRFLCQTPGAGLPGKPCAGGGCKCPYQTETEIAADLVGSHLLSKLFLVGYNVDDTAAIGTLNVIAQAGNSDAALLAADSVALRTRLQEVMHIAAPDATSRSVPVSVQTSLVNGRTYEITSGFLVGETASDPWSGILNRRQIGCENGVPDETATLQPSDLFHTLLNGQSTRTIFTAPPSTRQEAHGTLYGHYDPILVSPSTDAPLLPGTDVDGLTMNITNTRNLNQPNASAGLSNAAPASDSSITSAVALGQNIETTQVVTSDFTDTGGDALPPSLFSASGTADVTAIANYVLGRTGFRATHKLGDIFHSNPVVVNPLTSYDSRYLTSDARYAGWLNQLALTYPTNTSTGTQTRPGVVYVGTNDGILHAFNLEDWTSASGDFTAGHEFWGFVPPALFSKMEAMITPTHQFMFDGTPVVKDVVLHRASSGTRDAFYRTVLVSAVRGAPAFVAMDVTFPDRPQFMWQRTFSGLGNTVGAPAVTQVDIAWDGSHVEQRAIAILPGGAGLLNPGSCNVQAGDLQALAPNENARTAVRCWAQRGRSLYVVDVASGQLIQEFDSRHFPSPLTGAVSVDGLGTAISRAAYFSDADGVLWRLSMVNSNPSDWVVAPMFDMFHGAAYDAGRASTYAPTLSRDPFSNLVISAGTGDLDNLTDVAAQRVVSLTEKRVRIGTNGEIGDLPVNSATGPTINWELTLNPGESVTGPLTLFEDVLYFGTFESPTGSNGDACELGTSRLYGANVRLDFPVNSHVPKPELLEPGDPNTAADDTVVLSEVVDGTGSSLVLGLSISRQPVCTSTPIPTNATSGVGNFNPTSASQGGAFQLHALVGGGNDRAVGAKVGGSQLREFTRQLQVVGHATSVGFAGAVE